ncbi:MAG: PTS fructose transporter subunit IIA [Bacillota bacterium]|nr:PTS fructose transporter subunit IIA [Bacillota bacterium]
MKYVVLVSHGGMAQGMKTSLNMLAGEKEEVLAIGLPDGKTADEFAQMFEETISNITEDDEIILLADIIGGSPLTTSMNVLAGKGLLSNTTVLGGMSLPLALTTILMKDNMDRSMLVDVVLAEAIGSMKEFKMVSEDEEDDI